ncbi:heterokaryon incompatibility protein s [Podospora fimiseda]|uniref:Heterokaryon incompatibility protein s n=1 Tax=Podospora fimiseda TaxID=252190 RepID=A0AAN7BMB4_9PEZI|nr:heterokaryon incompatibility protein s [Podospora fimiseda]
METAGLVIGSVSIASLFTTCVDCFEYIQLGRHFGRDYQTAALKLDLLKLRLSRWANAVTESGYGAAVGLEEERAKVEEILGQIVYLFEDAEKRSAKFTKTSSTQAAPAASSEADFEALRLKMKTLALKRQKRSSFTQKASWAPLYEGKYFNCLIEDIDPLVRDLVELFPEAKTQQQQLAVEEAKELHVEKAIDTLQEANEGPGKDELLREAIAQAIAGGGQVKHQFRDNLAEGGVLVRYGDEIQGDAPATQGPGSVYEKNRATGKGTMVHYGDHHGQGSIFSFSPKRDSPGPETK